jgi:hypothetical protein
MGLRGLQFFGLCDDLIRFDILEAQAFIRLGVTLGVLRAFLFTSGLGFAPSLLKSEHVAEPVADSGFAWNILGRETGVMEFSLS